MAGTREGGLKAVATIRKKDPDHWRRAGVNGGRKSRGGGFQTGSQLTRDAGHRGGLSAQAKARAKKMQSKEVI